LETDLAEKYRIHGPAGDAKDTDYDEEQEQEKEDLEEEQSEVDRKRRRTTWNEAGVVAEFLLWATFGRQKSRSAEDHLGDYEAVPVPEDGNGELYYFQQHHGRHPHPQPHQQLRPGAPSGHITLLGPHDEGPDAANWGILAAAGGGGGGNIGEGNSEWDPVYAEEVESRGARVRRHIGNVLFMSVQGLLAVGFFLMGISVFHPTPSPTDLLPYDNSEANGGKAGKITLAGEGSSVDDDELSDFGFDCFDTDENLAWSEKQIAWCCWAEQIGCNRLVVLSTNAPPPIAAAPASSPRQQKSGARTGGENKENSENNNEHDDDNDEDGDDDERPEEDNHRVGGSDPMRRQGTTTTNSSEEDRQPQLLHLHLQTAKTTAVTPSSLRRGGDPEEEQNSEASKAAAVMIKTESARKTLEGTAADVDAWWDTGPDASSNVPQPQSDFQEVPVRYM